MRRVASFVGVGVGAVGTPVVITVVPWAHYGGIEMPLYRFPCWGFPATAVVALTLLAVWARAGGAGRPRHLRSAGLALAVAGVGATAVVMWHYDDADAFFGPIVPLVKPVIGPGGPLAMVLIAIDLIVLFGSTRPEIRDTAARRGRLDHVRSDRD